MNTAKKILNAPIMALAFMVAGCGANQAGVESTGAPPKKETSLKTSGFNLFPQSKKTVSVDESCVVTSERSTNLGLLLEIFLPLAPFTNSKDSTKTDRNCWDRLFVEKILQQDNSDDSRAIAVAIYDQLVPEEKKKIDYLLSASGTSMDEVGRDWPRVVSNTTRGDCAVILYKMPWENDSHSVTVFRCGEEKGANRNTARYQAPKSP